MRPKESIRGSSPEIEVVVEHDAWNTVAPDVARKVEHAAGLALQRASAAMSNADVVILLTDDERLRMLNREYRGKDNATNVLSFPAAPNTGHLGDIAIAYGVAKREADTASKPLLHHALHLTVHGVLHLLGYDHGEPAEADRMETLEAEILAEMDVADPYVQSESVQTP